MRTATYAEVLKERAEAARIEAADAKPLDHVGLQNKMNLKRFAERRMRHSLGLPTFHVKRSWLDRLLGR